MANARHSFDTDRKSRNRRPWWWYLIGALLLGSLAVGAMIIIGGGGHGGISRHQRPSHQNSAAHGRPAGVTTEFRKEPSGVLEMAVTRDPNNRPQIAIIRQQLTEEAQRYRNGEFIDPAVHREIRPEMQGLARLKAGAARINVVYQPLPNGAQIRLSSDDQSLTQLLHVWADMR